MTLATLPIDAVLPEFVAALQHCSSVVVQAPTGAGKTTRIPPAILDAGLAGDRLVVMLEPRRLAAITAARRMAFERHESVGQTVGYQVRFDRRSSNATRILVVTEGIFLRLLLDDPWLERVGVVVLDEFHERNMNSDLALAMTRRLQQEFRPELRLVVMSATLDPQPLTNYLSCPAVISEGRLHPVEIRYLPLPERRPTAQAVASGVRALLPETPGDLLAFLPGVGEIRRARQELTPDETHENLLICELYGDLSVEQQDLALRPASRRKVILATNVAETSVTIEGVTGVVDSGLARVLRCDLSVGLNRLEVERISRASADQRAGRAGRTGPGVCLRLWTEHEHRFLAARQLPEIQRLDLAAPLLTLLSWGESHWSTFPWFESPPAAAWEQAERLLRQLGAWDGERLTPLGRQLSLVPVHPRLARLLVEGQHLGCLHRTALAAALLSERDPFAREPGRASAHLSHSDLLDRVAALEAFQQFGHRDSAVGRIHLPAAQRLFQVQEQLLREIGESTRSDRAAETRRDEPFLRSLVAAFPDRVARRREPHSRRGLMVGGRGVRLADFSSVGDAELFLCIDIEEVGGSEALVRQASRVDRGWLPRERITSVVEVDFDEQRERVRCVRRTRYEDLVLDEVHAEAADPAEIGRTLAAAASRQLGKVLPLQEEETTSFLARVAFLRQWLPDLGWPEFNDDILRGLLPDLCVGRRSFADLRAAPLLDYLRGALTPHQLATLDREAPERITAASGSRIRLVYEPGRPPVMPVRIQEMFGQLDTPRVASGRVPVLLHLLAPNMRPQQVTDDLRGFWERAYPIVRKELRRRYPKHSWPDDPAHSPPERRPQRKG